VLGATEEYSVPFSKYIESRSGSRSGTWKELVEGTPWYCDARNHQEPGLEMGGAVVAAGESKYAVVAAGLCVNSRGSTSWWVGSAEY
jgi:hypothetical protein